MPGVAVASLSPCRRVLRSPCCSSAVADGLACARREAPVVDDGVGVAFAVAAGDAEAAALGDAIAVAAGEAAALGEAVAAV